MVEYIPFSDDADSEFDLLSETQQLFGPDTPLKDAENVGGRPYEERPQQISMAQKIAEAMQEGKHLCVEAPTGVGKSIAYLIPAILRARHTGKAVVVSTHTIALQEQLIEKDIPMLQRCLGIPFSATLAKGRANYVCLHRLKNCHHQHQDFLPDERLLPEVARIANWAEESKDGSLTDLPFKPDSQTWSSVCSEAGVCSREQNYPDQHCFFAKARRRLYTVDIIVTNHALLCSDIAMREESDGLQSILPDYGALVIDEAHTFEQVAATHLGIRVNTFGVFLLLSRLYNTRSRRGLLHRAEAMEARQACIAATETTTRFFKQLESWLADQHENPLAFKDAGHIPNKLKEPWQQLSKEIQTLAKTTVDDDYRRELNSVNDRLIETGRNLDIFFSRQLEDYVYWFERFGRDLRYISFNAVPIEVNSILRNVLFNKEFPVIMTSATMAVNNKLSYFKERLGCDEAMDVILDSPFNFAEQVDLYVPAKEMPDPRDQDSYIEACCQQIKHFLEMSQGRAFVLFTSYRQMHTVADLLADYFFEQDYRLLVQGKDLQRNKMLEIFREDTHSVLFGTDSFWMGVDVPGEALSNVIIVRLPFPVPSHPLVEAVCKRLEEQGQSAFYHYSLPEAVLKFRQGCGRLIRSQTDKGMIVILDPRVATSGYGKSFLNAIPPCRQHIDS